MRRGLTFRSGRTCPADVRSSDSGTLSRIRSLVGYTIDTHESEFSEATPVPAGGRRANARRALRLPAQTAIDFVRGDEIAMVESQPAAGIHHFIGGRRQ